MSTTDARTNPTPTERSGAKRWSHQKLVRKGIVLDEAAPTTYQQGVNPGEFHSVLWGVLKPAGVTSYTLNVYKLLGVYKDDNSAIVEGWVLEASYPGLTGSTVKLQAVDGCRVQVQVASIVVGAGIGDGFSIVRIGTNRQS